MNSERPPNCNATLNLSKLAPTIKVSDLVQMLQIVNIDISHDIKHIPKPQ
jgi:hypothetical protein